MKFSVLSQPVGLLKFMQILFAQVIFKGENSAEVILWSINNIIMCQDTCELICLKLSMMLNTSKLYCLIPVWITLMFNQGHRVVNNVNRA